MKKQASQAGPGKSARSLADIASELSSKLNNSFKKQYPGGVAQVLTPTNTEPTEFIKTGSRILDLAISSVSDGGLPVGKLVEIFGESQSGKSLLVTSVLANTQKAGGIAILFDPEHAFNPDFGETLGIDRDALLYAAEMGLTDTLASIEQTVKYLRVDKGFEGPITIAVDSIAAARVDEPDTLKDGLYNIGGYRTGRARILSEWLPRLINLISTNRVLLIFTNQLRTRINPKYGETEYTTTSGRALEFYAGVRVYLKSVNKIIHELENASKSYKYKHIVGNSVVAVVMKTRNGPPERIAKFNIFFSHGIDDYGTWLENMKIYGLIQVSGAWSSFTNPDIYDGKFQEKTFIQLIRERADIREKSYNALLEIMLSNPKLGVDFNVEDTLLESINSVYDDESLSSGVDE